MRYPVKVFKNIDNNGKLKIKAKVDFFEIVKVVAKQLGDVSEISNAELEISLLLPKRYKAETKKLKRKKLEKQLLDDVDALVNAESVAAVHMLYTSRSDVLKYVVNACNTLMHSNGMRVRGESTREGKGSSTMEVYDDDVEVKGELLKKIRKIEKVKANANKPISKWNSIDFLKFIKDKFKEAYGVNTFEIQSNKQLKHGINSKGKIPAMVKTALIGKFKKQGMTKNDLAKYIAWVYEEKSQKIKFPITIAFLCSNTLITEWFVGLSKGGKAKNKRARFKK